MLLRLWVFRSSWAWMVEFELFYCEDVIERLRVYLKQGFVLLCFVWDVEQNIRSGLPQTKMWRVYENWHTHKVLKFSYEQLETDGQYLDPRRRLEADAQVSNAQSFELLYGWYQPGLRFARPGLLGFHPPSRASFLHLCILKLAYRQIAATSIFGKSVQPDSTLQSTERCLKRAIRKRGQQTVGWIRHATPSSTRWALHYIGSSFFPICGRSCKVE